MTKFYYEYSPYTTQDDQPIEIPAFEIFNEVGEKLADTIEHIPMKQQENIAQLFCAAPELLKVLKAAQKCFGQHNLLSTATDNERRVAIQRFSNWMNYSLAVLKFGWHTPYLAYCFNTFPLNLPSSVSN
ncbi:MAG: hypothetical protein DHS20C18_40280 [Saprospiraceae bacterium]|nr:MAG: hypothetical protein DHS20C18_40280 [Saprospiraceae bacterium]